MTNERKAEIAARFVAYPMLSALVRALLHGFWFRIVFVLGLLAPLAGVAFLAKVWRVTPEGFHPVVRISGLDFFQARSLRRAAERAFAEGRVDAGVLAWRGAIANHPADLEMLRNFLRQVPRQVEAPAHQAEVVPLAPWLLRLSATNVVDLEIVSELLLHYGHSQMVVGLLSPHRDRFTDALKRAYLKALFEEDLFEDFAASWKDFSAGGVLRSDEALDLYRKAFHAGWGEPSEAAAALAELEAAFDASRWRVLARRLALKVYAQRGQIEAYFRTLEQLEAWQKDSVKDHIRGWQLLAANARQPEAVERARNLPPRPMSARDTVLLGQALFDLGLRDLALQALDRFSLEFGFSDELWVTYANLLVEAARWEALSQLAVTIRTHEDVGVRLRPLSFYLEGRAELGQGHQAAAAAAFGRIEPDRVENLGLAFAMANNLRRLGYPALARDLLRPHEDTGRRFYAYWRLLSQIGFDLKDAALVCRAAENAFGLSPQSAEARHNYTAALLLARQRPDEAMKHAFELLRESPNRTGVRLNYAAALIQNHRYAEATQELDVLQRAALPEAQRANCESLRCELLARLGRKEEAREVRARLDPKYLFPEEAAVLAELVREPPAE